MSMKKLLLYLSVIGLALVAFPSCSKDESYWKVETSSIEYYNYSDYLNFANEIDDLDDGVTWTVSQVENKVNSIVKRYDGDLGGQVYLKTGSSMSGPWKTKKTWTMRLR